MHYLCSIYALILLYIIQKFQIKKTFKVNLHVKYQVVCIPSSLSEMFHEDVLATVLHPYLKVCLHPVYKIKE